METVLKPFVSRFAQPVILSFCIAWIFWNWEIVIGLIWYNATTLPNYGYKNYRELIHDNAIWQRNYLYPLLAAIAFPYLRFGLNYYNTQLKTEERNSTLQVAGSGKMSTLRFLELRKSYEDKISQLSAYFEEQATIQKRDNEKDTEIIKLKTDLDRTKESLSSYQQAERVRADDIHDVQMELRESKEMVDKLNNKLILVSDENEKFRQNINEIVDNYELYSSAEYLLASYIFRLSRKMRVNLTPISEGLGLVKQENLLIVLEFEEVKIGVVSGYYYNIMKKNLLIKFQKHVSNPNNDWDIILDKHLEFNFSDDRSILSTDLEYEGKHYRFELQRIS